VVSFVCSELPSKKSIISSTSDCLGLLSTTRFLNVAGASK